MNTGPLTPEHAEALRGVDLLIHGDAHGASDYYDGLFYKFTTGINDETYEQAKTMVQNLDPTRGDKLAIESRGYDPAVPSDAAIMDFRYSSQDIAKMDQTQKDKVAKNLEVDAYHYINSPFEYAAGHAMLRGISVEYADIDKETYQDMLNIRDEMALATKLGRIPAVMRNEIINFILGGPEKDLREWHMLAKLGEIASIMTSTPMEKGVQNSEQLPPTLAFLVGKYHLFSLATKLNKYDIPFGTNKNPYIQPLNYASDFVTPLFYNKEKAQWKRMQKRRRQTGIL